MARPTTHTMTLGQMAGRSQPHYVMWRETLNGERVTRRKFFTTEAEAEAYKAQQERLAATLAPPPPTSAPERPADADARVLTYRRFATRWLADIVARRKPATARSYTDLLTNHVYPTLGDTPVAQIGVDEVVGVITARAQAGVKWGTQKAVLRVISSSLRWAVRGKHLAVNPALGLIKDLKDDSGDYVDPEPNPLSATEFDAFITWLETGTVPGKPNRPVDGPKLRGGQLRQVGYPEWRDYFLTLGHTGMRRGEAAALKWSSVYVDDTDAPHLRLMANYSPSAKKAKPGSSGDGTLKTKHARDIDASEDVADALREAARTRRAEALRERRALKPYVFVTRSGARITPDCSTAERVFELGMAALGLTKRGHTIHDLRDTFATCHLIAGKPLLWVSHMLGHKKPSTTHDRYAKWLPATHAGGHALASSTFASRRGRGLGATAERP